MSGYNGWKNYQTWNVALWIDNDAFLHSIARESRSYLEFRENLRELSNDCRTYETGDGVSWNDSAIDLHQLESFWQDSGFGIPPLVCRKLASGIEEFGIPKGGFR